MDANDIKDRETLERWLTARPHGDAIVIAQRAAMRVLPLVRFDRQARWSRNPDLTPLAILRANLTSGVARKYPTPEVKAAAARAAAAAARAAAAAKAAIARTAAFSARAAAARAARAADAADADFSAAYSAFSAADAATRTAFSAADAADAAAAAARAVSAATAATVSDAAKAAFWEQIRNDARALHQGGDPQAPPLWPDASPDWLVPALDATRLYWQADPGLWSFWQRWYDAAVAGTPLNWEMQRDIALIADEDWQAGPERVAGRIAEIEASYRVSEIISQNPYAMRVEYDVRRHKLVAFPVDAPDLDAIVAAIRSAVSDFLLRCKRDSSPNRAGAELLRITIPAISDLRRDLRRHGANPLALYEAISDAGKELLGTVAEPGLSQDVAFVRLADRLERCAGDILVASPAALETVKRRNAVELELLKADQLVRLSRLCAGMQADSEGWLKASAAIAIQVLADPAHPVGERQAAFYFMKAVVPRGAKAMREHEAAAPVVPKRKSILDKAMEAADKAVKIDKGIDAVQEIVPEGWDWVSRVFSEIQSGNLWGLG